MICLVGKKCRKINNFLHNKSFISQAQKTDTPTSLFSTFFPKPKQQEETHKKYIYFLSVSSIFPAPKQQTKRDIEREIGTLMVLTAGLFNRFKCFWTSNFCLDKGKRAAQDSETKPSKKTRATKALVGIPVLTCAAVAAMAKNPENPEPQNA